MNINSLPRCLPQPCYEDESKSDNESSPTRFNRNISKTAQARFGKSGNTESSLLSASSWDVNQKHDIDPEVYIAMQEAYINQNPAMEKFYLLIRSKLNSLFISLFAADGGFVQKNTPTPLAAKVLQGVGSLSPEPISATVSNALGTGLQIYKDQEHANRVESSVEVCLDPYLATEYARRTAIQLCEIYEDQIKELLEEGVERLARFAITACYEFLEDTGLTVDQPIQKELIKAILEKAGGKRSVATMLTAKAAQKAERYKLSKKIVNFFRITHLELPTQQKHRFEGKPRKWKADKLFSRCGIRVREGDEWIYYGNDKGKDDGDTGEMYTRAELYGFRVGTEKEAKALGMKKLRRSTHPSRFPETIDLPLSTGKNNRGYQDLIEVWKTFAENCAQAIAEQNAHLSQHSGDIEWIQKEQGELRESIKTVSAFLEHLTQAAIDQSKHLSQNSESLAVVRREQGELTRAMAKHEEQLSQNSVALQVMIEEQRKLEEHIETLRSFSENCTKAMKNQDEHLFKHSTALEEIQEGQKKLPKLVEDLKSFSESFERAMAKQDEHLSQHSAALEMIQEEQRKQLIETVNTLAENLKKAMAEHRTDQTQNSESLELIQKELGKLPDLVNAVKMFSENSMQAIEKQGQDISQNVSAFLQEAMTNIGATLEKLARDRHPPIQLSHVNNVQQGLKAFYSTQEKSIIQLAFSNRKLDIKGSFVQLALIQEEVQKKKEERLGPEEEKQKEDGELRETLLETYETIHAVKKPVELEGIFDLGQKLLLLGRAGIGKSTLCQKIVHMWATEGLWNNRFHYLFGISLRNLTESRYPHGKHFLENILAGECFPPQDQEGELHLVQDIREVLKHHSNQILLIIDGYDEKTQMPPAIHSQLFERQDLPAHMIVTSRPYGTEVVKHKMDATLENMGFTEQHIETYISNYFGENPQVNVFAFIKERRDLITMAHVPLLLEMLCFLWEEKGEEIADLTMVELYKAMVERGFERYFSRQKDHALSRQKSQLRRYAEKHRGEAELSSALGKIALEGIKQGQILIDGRLIKDILHDFDDIGIEEIYGCGFLKATEGNHKEWKPGYFMHLSIQEYFAALYLATEGPAVYRKEMMSNKYNPFMQLVWAMCAGLLGSRRPKEENDVASHQRVNEFFASLHEEPQDLIGRYHNRLAISCLNACADRGNLYSQIERRYKTLSCLKDFIRLALESRGSFALDLSLEFRSPPVMKYCLMEIIERLGDGDGKGFGRLAAAKALGEIKGVEALIERLGDGKASVRKAAAEALGEIKDAAAVEALIERLRDENMIVRGFAAMALGEIKDAAAVRALIEMLDDGSQIFREVDFVREAAEKALGKIKDAGAVELLIESLGNGNVSVREAAAKALGEIKDSVAVRALIERLGDGDRSVRKAAAEALGEIKDAAAVEALIEMLRDEDRSDREAAAKALGEIKDVAAVDALIERLRDEEGFVRWAAAEALGKIKDVAAIEALIERLGDGNSSVGRAAAKALVEIKDAAAVGLLIERLGDENGYVRGAAAWGLGEIKDVAAVKALIKRLGDEDRSVREAAAKALGEIKDVAAVEALIERLGDGNGDVREAAAKALGEIKDVAAVKALIERLRDEDRSVREAAAESLRKMDYKSLLTSALNSNQMKDFKVIVKKALSNNHPLFLRRNEQNEYDLVCGREQLLNSISERGKRLIKKGLNNALSKELGSVGG